MATVVEAVCVDQNGTRGRVLFDPFKPQKQPDGFGFVMQAGKSLEILLWRLRASLVGAQLVCQ